MLRTIAINQAGGEVMCQCKQKEAECAARYAGPNGPLAPQSNNANPRGR